MYHTIPWISKSGNLLKRLIAVCTANWVAVGRCLSRTRAKQTWLTRWHLYGCSSNRAHQTWVSVCYCYTLLQSIVLLRVFSSNNEYRTKDECTRNSCGARAEEIVSALNIVDKLVESGNVEDASDVSAVVDLLQQLQPTTRDSTRSEEENALRDIVNVTLDILNTLIGKYDPLLISQSNASAKYAHTLGFYLQWANDWFNLRCWSESDR